MRSIFLFLILILLPLLSLADTGATGPDGDYKRKLLSELRGKLQQAGADGYPKVDSSAAEATCISSQETITACRRAIRSVEKALIKEKGRREPVVSIDGGSYRNYSIEGHPDRFDQNFLQKKK